MFCVFRYIIKKAAHFTFYLFASLGSPTLLLQVTLGQFNPRTVIKDGSRSIQPTEDLTLDDSTHGAFNSGPFSLGRKHEASLVKYKSYRKE